MHFWIDALCINQADIPEKSKQVSQLTTMYESAEDVFACLGKPPLDKASAGSPFVELDIPVDDVFCSEPLDCWVLSGCYDSLFDRARTFEILAHRTAEARLRTGVFMPRPKDLDPFFPYSGVY